MVLVSRIKLSKITHIFHIYHQITSIFSPKTQDKLLCSLAPWQIRPLLTWLEFPGSVKDFTENVKAAITRDKIPIRVEFIAHFQLPFISGQVLSSHALAAKHFQQCVVNNQVRAFFGCVIKSHCFQFNFSFCRYSSQSSPDGYSYY